MIVQYKKTKNQKKKNHWQRPEMHRAREVYVCRMYASQAPAVFAFAAVKGRRRRPKGRVTRRDGGRP